MVETIFPFLSAVRAHGAYRRPFRFFLYFTRSNIRRFTHPHTAGWLSSESWNFSCRAVSFPGGKNPLRDLSFPWNFRFCRIFAPISQHLGKVVEPSVFRHILLNICCCLIAQKHHNSGNCIESRYLLHAVISATVTAAKLLQTGTFILFIYFILYLSVITYALHFAPL